MQHVCKSLRLQVQMMKGSPQCPTTIQLDQIMHIIESELTEGDHSYVSSGSNCYV